MKKNKHASMRSGVTGRNRTDTGGTTTRSSAVELRPHLNARWRLSTNWSWWSDLNGRPRAPKASALPAAPHRGWMEGMKGWYPRVGTIHRPPPYQDGALPLSYTRDELAPRHGLEPRTSWLTARRYYRLSYRGMDSGTGFEPVWAGCRRICKPPPSTAWLSRDGLERAARFERATSCLEGRSSTR